MAISRGYHFFQNPGPTNIPDRVLRAMDRGTIDFTGAKFRTIAAECVAGLKRVFKTEATILTYAASGHGAWEAALVNLFSPGDRVLVVETGYFSLNWGLRCEAFGLEVENSGHRLAPLRRRGSARNPAARGSRARHQGGARRAQRDLDRGRARHRGAAPGDRRRPASGTVSCRRDLVLGVDGFPHGRMGCRCRRRRLAEGADAADRHGLYRDQRAGARRRRRGEIAAGLLGLAPAGRGQRAGGVERHRAGASLLRAAGGIAHDRRGRSRPRLCPTPPARRGDKARGARLAGRTTGRRFSPPIRAANRIL